jgi:hypothetical protein
MVAMVFAAGNTKTFGCAPGKNELRNIIHNPARWPSNNSIQACALTFWMPSHFFKRTQVLNNSVGRTSYISVGLTLKLNVPVFCYWYINSLTKRELCLIGSFSSHNTAVNIISEPVEDKIEAVYIKIHSHSEETIVILFWMAYKFAKGEYPSIFNFDFLFWNFMQFSNGRLWVNWSVDNNIHLPFWTKLKI